MAAITCGFHYRTRVIGVAAGEWRVAQGREVRADLSWAVEAMPRVTPGPAERRARIKSGDVLVLARGERPYALVTPAWPWPALASSSFYVVRVRPEYLLPEYLAWYLNTPGIAGRLMEATRGAKIRWLPRSALLELAVDAPSLARQKDVAVAAALVGEEDRLHAELSAERTGALSRLVAYEEGAESGSRAEHIRIAEAQLEVVRMRLARHFEKLGL